MSTLSEALERCLKKVQNPTKPTVAPELPKVYKAAFNYTNPILSTTLFFKEGSSDKVYKVEVVQPDRVYDGYEVHFQYGRRGGTLQKGSKTDQSVTFQEAMDIYTKIINEKIAKGYHTK